MICQSCHQKQAAVVLKKSINGVDVASSHLCHDCAEKGEGVITLDNLFSSMLSGDFMTKSFLHEKQEEKETFSCQGCGLTAEEFMNIGRYGCSGCYRIFKRFLPGILKNVQGGNQFHQGKRAKGQAHTGRVERLKECRKKLAEYVREEKFELAASIRDEIRALEAEDGDSV